MVTTALDVALVVLATARFTRFLTVDDLGVRIITRLASPLHRRWVNTDREWLLDGLHCAWCVGFWLSAAAVIAMAAMPPGTSSARPLRWLAAPWALSYIIGHVSSRID